jgi:NAD(P)-dependent dehydrogenase (short-subunit alcohol dehydrogenase family)
VFFCLQRVAREMIPRRSGVIVNIASIAGKGYVGASNDNLKSRAREEGVTVNEMERRRNPGGRGRARPLPRLPGRAKHHGASFNVDGGMIFD